MVIYMKLGISEQISIDTRTLVSLDKTTFGSRMLRSWNDYEFVYSEGKYRAPIGDDVFLVIELSGKCYILYETTAGSGSELMSIFRSLADFVQYDIVKINLLENFTYAMNQYVWEDQEWSYVSRFSYGQLIVEGNGATLVGNGDYNFMYIGSEDNVNFLNVNIKHFNHCFINHGTLMCEKCFFSDNRAYKFDVKISGSGTIVHNYNTVYFDWCSFNNNTAEYWGIYYQSMAGSILYAEEHSLNIFRNIYGVMDSDCLYCCDYSTTVIYQVHQFFPLFEQSYISQYAYFSLVNSTAFSTNRTMEINVSNSEELLDAFLYINNFPDANNIVINMKSGSYTVSVNDYSRVRTYDWRAKAYNPGILSSAVIKERYLLDVGYCPITINGNGAHIILSGNDLNDDYHFANIGKYGYLTLNSLTVSKFNTAFFVQGHCFFKG